MVKSLGGRLAMERMLANRTGGTSGSTLHFTLVTQFQDKNHTCSELGINQHVSKILFLTVNASLRWLDNVSGVCLVHVSLLLIGQQGLGHFFRYRLLLLIGWRIMQIMRTPRETMSLLVQYKHQANQL
jgi:hypothetical protein